MKKGKLSSLLLAAFVLPQLAFGLNVGASAPSFSVKDLEGKDKKLSDYRGKFVVLEWHNQGCPFVKKHYESKNMQKLQKEWTGKGAAWLTVISSAKGSQGFVSPAEEKTYLAKNEAAPTDVLLDSDGKMGKAYGAKTTPHMFVIDPSGKVIYQGAIDDNDSTEAKDALSAKNYVSTALTEAMSGKAVTTASTKPYGCSVKYKD